jgi:4-hydroxy-tetrahydrodipicolinate reductase
MTTVAINGITGQMGDSLLETAADREDVTVVLGIGPDPEAVTAVPTVSPADTTRALDEHTPDVVLDFSTPAGTETVARAAAETETPLVVGTTGLGETAEAALADAGGTVPVLVGANFARGIQALLEALDVALESLPGYDIEILETHHNRKADAPSGTAETILDRVASHREVRPVPGREGHQPRGEDEVGVLVRRAGDVCGEHEVVLADNDELLSITHRAGDRGVFAAGALDAAVWLDGRHPGRYTFADVLSSAAGATGARAAQEVRDQ